MSKLTETLETLVDRHGLHLWDGAALACAPSCVASLS